MRFALFCVAIALHGALPWPAAAQQVIESYIAVLSDRDHYNSRGERLSQYWQIIRQDRANYHRFGIRDAGDEGDAFFASIENRALAERLLLSGYVDPNTAAYIVNNPTTVRVTLYGYGSTVSHIDVIAY